MSFLMMAIWFLTHFCFIGHYECSESFNSIIEFLSQFLKCKNPRFVIFFMCLARNDSAKLHKMVNNLNAMATFIKPTNYLSNYKRNIMGRVFANSNNIYVIDISCDNSTELLNRASTAEFSSSHEWIILDPLHLYSIDEYQVIFKKLKLRMDSSVTLAVLNDILEDYVEFYDLYNPGLDTGGNTVFTDLGIWNGTNRACTSIEIKSTKYRNRENMTGINLRVATVITENFSVPVEQYLQETHNKVLDTNSKYNHALFIHVREMHNFSQTLLVTDKWFGSAERGTDAGIAKLLNEEKVDITSCAGMIEDDKIDVLDFVTPTYPFRTCFIFKNPRIRGTVRNEIFRPFTVNTWFAVILCIILICIALKLTWWGERKLINLHCKCSIMTTFVITLGALCQQGSGTMQWYTAGRIVILSLLMLSLLLYNYYTSSVVSSLLSDVPSPYDNIQDLANSEMKVGLEKSVYITKYFETTTEASTKIFYRTKIFPPEQRYPFYFKPEVGIQKVRGGGFAYHTEASTAYDIILNTFSPAEICELEEINFIKPIHLAIMAQKNSQYKKLFSISYRKMMEAGIMNRHIALWQTPKPSCFTGMNLLQVGLEQSSPAFLFLSAGGVLAVILLIIEIFWYKHNRIPFRLQSVVEIFHKFLY